MPKVHMSRSEGQRVTAD